MERDSVVATKAHITRTREAMRSLFKGCEEHLVAILQMGTHPLQRKAIGQVRTMLGTLAPLVDDLAATLEAAAREG